MASYEEGLIKLQADEAIQIQVPPRNNPMMFFVSTLGFKSPAKIQIDPIDVGSQFVIYHSTQTRKPNKSNS